MTMFIVLVSAMFLSFITHLYLMIAAFQGNAFNRVRYFWSQVTLWLTGLLLLLITIVAHPTGSSAFFIYFDTAAKKVLIPVATLLVSAIAHIVVRQLQKASKIPS